MSIPKRIWIRGKVEMSDVWSCPANDRDLALASLHGGQFNLCPIHGVVPQKACRVRTRFISLRYESLPVTVPWLSNSWALAATLSSPPPHSGAVATRSYCKQARESSGSLTTEQRELRAKPN